MKFRRHYICALSLAVLCIPPSVHSQDTIEEIVVTAQKRQQSLMDVGISVAVANEQEIRDRRINMMTDILLFAPATNIKENTPGIKPIISIRGVGLNDFNAANNPAAGVYIDEVSLSSLALLSSDFYDLQQIEVLKGPQGTLYGRNSTAGAINIVTAKPDFDSQYGRLSLGAGDYDLYEVEGMFNVPLSDTAALRLSGKSIQQQEGFYEDQNGNVGEREVLMARAQLALKPTDAADVLFKIEHQEADNETGQPDFFGALPTATQSNCPGLPTCSNFLGYADTDGDEFGGSYSTPHDYEFDQLMATLRVNVDFDIGTLTAVTGYIDFDRTYITDVDASPARILDFYNFDDVEQISQEIRLAGESDALIWQIGAYYAKDEIKTTYAGDLQDLLNTTTFSESNIEAESHALFANVEWSLAENVDLILGLRATNEDKSNFGFTDDLVSEAPISFLTLVPQGTGPIRIAAVDDEISEDSVDWRVGVNWHLDSALVYAVASQGTKSGGFFTGVATTNAQLIPYDAEELVAFEVGIKGQLSDRGFAYEVAAYYYNYDDVQTLTTDNSGAVTVIRLNNIDGATIYGLDAFTRWSPPSVEGLDLTLGVAFLDTELEAFDGPAGPIPKGNEQADSPEFSTNISATYAFGLTDSVTADVSVDGRFQTESFTNASNIPLSETDDYWVINARMSLYIEEDWQVTLWGRNLADERYMVEMYDGLSLGNGYRVYGPPRTWGITATRFFE